ncbi:monovalent cation/H(+) antiporter subunit G [Peteryoungia ipomoeae]|uniref:Monovalent cation/H(+) antiporter subunit G n=1 Tax=Peteryoungia ipomoeae TaxID=1210932 RepID=A0A4S8P0C8_9HYPH|nr:monovalent cation/H(+) antiporter subunit G [Peteryoungia ipomoeae]THV20974.1 monovalent cation/H(+) antiporter subunit G [Peteryoungia ipomoeae]
MLAILSILFKLAGVVFLCIAAYGVIKLADPFQRMHAATKAGTLGAGLVIIGSVIAHGAFDATVMGVLTVVFLLLTVPVAGHLLGRAAYVSGAQLTLSGDDALSGVLTRADQSLGTRSGWVSVAPKTLVGETENRAPGSKPAPRIDMPVLPALGAVRFAVIDGQVAHVAERACAIAKQSGASLSAHTIIDTHAIHAAADQARVRRLIRERASDAISDLKSVTAETDVASILHYDEGDPEAILRCETQPGQTLLVLPCQGWFHHQVEARMDRTTWDPDGLLRLPSCHGGPVLFVAKTPLPDTAQTLVVRDCGEDHLAPLVEWSLLNNLWKVTQIVHVADKQLKDKGFAEIADRFGCSYARHAAPDTACAIPAGIVGMRAVVLGRTPRPLRTNWFGAPWLSRITPEMAGDVLIMER